MALGGVQPGDELLCDMNRKVPFVVRELDLDGDRQLVFRGDFARNAPCRRGRKILDAYGWAIQKRYVIAWRPGLHRKPSP